MDANPSLHFETGTQLRGNDICAQSMVYLLFERFPGFWWLFFWRYVQVSARHRLNL